MTKVALAAMLVLALVGGLAASAAQVAPRVTGLLAEQQMDTARAALKAALRPDSPADLAQASRRLDELDARLRSELGNDASKPLQGLSSRQQVLVLHARAAAAMTLNYLKASDNCMASEIDALTTAYVTSMEGLVGGVIKGGTLAKLARLVHVGKGGSMAVIDGVLDPAQKPVFALQQGVPLANIVLHGNNLSDPQCADPGITAMDADGKPLPTQPTIVGVSPSAIELHWPDAGSLSPGTYLIRVVPKKHHLLVGCRAQAPARVALQVVPVPVFHISYKLKATCAVSASGTSATHELQLASGKMPEIKGFGHTVSVPVNTAACRFPVSYAIYAQVDSGSGKPVSIGPISQSADAQIATGLPGGLTMNWNPSMQQLFVSSGVRSCKGIDSTPLKAAAAASH